MDLDTRRILAQFSRLARLRACSAEAIANAQKMGWPYAGLNDTQRLFVALLSAEVRDTAMGAFRQFGVGSVENAPQTRGREIEAFLALDIDAQMAEIAGFYAESAEFTGTTAELMAAGRLAAVDAIIASATEMMDRAVRVLEQDETVSGRAISHGPLWYK
jgi:hypothetical protein